MLTAHIQDATAYITFETTRRISLSAQLEIQLQEQTTYNEEQTAMIPKKLQHDTTKNIIRQCHNIISDNPKIFPTLWSDRHQHCGKQHYLFLHNNTVHKTM